MSRRFTSIVVIIGSVICVPLSAQAQVTLPTSGSYSENFDNLGSGLPTGWTVRDGATNTSLGRDVSQSNFQSNSTSWGSTLGQFGNYASASNPGANGSQDSLTQSGYMDRALGVRQTKGSSGFGNPGAAFTLQLANTTGYKDFNLSFSAQLLHDLGYNTTYTVRYGTGTNPSNFTSVGTFTTNSLGNGTFGATAQSFSLNGIDNSPNAVWIQMAALTSSGTGDFDNFAIDNVQLTYTPAPEPTTVGLVATAGLGAIGLIRRARRKAST